MDFSASAATKDAARNWRRRSCTPPRPSSTPPLSSAAISTRRHTGFKTAFVGRLQTACDHDHRPSVNRFAMIISSR
jgi:hypothetical protein